MTFFERYAELCREKGYKPISADISEKIGVARSTISLWNQKDLAPKAEQLVKIADLFGVSVDYLLDRTDDPTDYTKHKASPTGFEKLDAIDRVRVEAYITGLLASGKYKQV